MNADSGAESSGADGYVGGTRCPTDRPGPELVFIPAGEGPFCIDAHEVRQSEYAEFLAAIGVDPPTQSLECAWNERFDPIPIYGDGPRPIGSCAAGVFDPATRGRYSMTCADWCDAKAYCEWAGKRLCGGIGDLDETLETQTDPSISEWQYACTNGGLYPYPYGPSYIAGKCVDENYTDTDVIAGSMGSPECTGVSSPFNQIVDLAGSVTEWTAACGEGYCSIQGGPQAGHPASCASGAITGLRTTSAAVGFRCCADAI